MAVPNTFASATGTIPLSQLDANFAYYDAALAITGTNVVIGGTGSAASLSPTGSSAPTNGAYLPAANAYGVATNSAQAWVVDVNGMEYNEQPNVSAVNSSAALTIAQILTKIITTTSTTAVTLTLPTGTLTDAGIMGGALATNMAFEWYVINLGSSSGAITMAPGTNHTYVGSTSVPIATSARFRTRKTATNTYVTYRIG